MSMYVIRNNMNYVITLSGKCEVCGQEVNKDEQQTHQHPIDSNEQIHQFELTHGDPKISKRTEDEQTKHITIIRQIYRANSKSKKHLEQPTVREAVEVEQI